MPPNNPQTAVSQKTPVIWIFIAMVGVGLAAFIYELLGPHPERAWEAYLINFLLWSGMAQGAVVFSALMHMTKARWSGPLAGLSESFAAFFPFSFVLFLLLFFGKVYLFPWQFEDLHGKEIWLNMTFLFWRDCIGLIILYILGLAYLFNALQLRFDPTQMRVGIRKFVYTVWKRNGGNTERLKQKMTLWGGLYILSFALVLSLLGYDLVMSMDPHWVSTLFGAYTFVKAFYVGLGALIVLAAIYHLKKGSVSGLTESHFHDIGKLFFAFGLLWADFFYVQLVVIWYGNIPEETHYVIQRTMLPPWRTLAWMVFFMAFILPFVVLLNKKIKSRPIWMLLLSTVVISGIWLEHFLLVGPALYPHVTALPLSFSDGLISLGFLGQMAIALSYFLQRFPELVEAKKGEIG